MRGSQGLEGAMIVFPALPFREKHRLRLMATGVDTILYFSQGFQAGLEGVPDRGVMMVLRVPSEGLKGTARSFPRVSRECRGL